MLRLLRLKMCLVREIFFSFEIGMNQAFYYMTYLGLLDIIIPKAEMLLFFVLVMMKSRYFWTCLDNAIFFVLSRSILVVIVAAISFICYLCTKISKLWKTLSLLPLNLILHNG